MRRPRTAHALRGAPCSMCDIIRYGYFSQVRFLVGTGSDLECRERVSRRTPLMLCALMEPAEWGASIAMTLLEAGARPGTVDARGHNALHLACIWCREQLVRVLLRAIDFDLGRQDKDGNTALHLAAMSGDVSVTQLVAQTFRKYCVNLKKTNCRGMTAGEEALRAGYTSCAHAIDFALAARRPGSAMKDVRFAETLETPTVCNEHTDRASHDRSSRGTAATSGDSVGVHRMVLLNTLSHGDGSSITSLDKDCGAATPRSNSEMVSPGTETNDSVFLDSVTSTPDVFRSAQTMRNRRLVRSPRPMSAAFLTRHDSVSTLTSTEEKKSIMSYRSPISPRTRKRKSHNPLYAYGYKKDGDAIRCAPDSDFRNTREFVCKIVHLPYVPCADQDDDAVLKDTIECNGPWMNATEGATNLPDQMNGKDGWRQELKSIFKVYEHQCSPSWRSGRKLEYRPVTPDPSIPEEWDKGRRARRQSITMKGHPAMPTLIRRSSIAIRPKRSGSTTSNHGRAVDGGGMEPSGESTISPTPGRRRSGIQLDIILSLGSRADSTSTKVRAENNSTPNNNYSTNNNTDGPSPLPVLYQHVDKVIAPSSSTVSGAITSTNVTNSNHEQKSQEGFHSHQSPEDGTSRWTKPNNNIMKKGSRKGTGKPVAENKTSAREDTRKGRGNHSINRTDVPKVNEILVPDSELASTPVDMKFVDTNKLWVQHPYDNDDDDDDNNDYNSDCN